MPTRYKGAPREVRALDVYIKLNRATETLGAKVNQNIAAHELTFPQFAALEALYHLGPMNQRALGSKLLRSSANTTAVLDNLESRGFIQRRRESDDRRVIMLHLTTQGRERIAAAFPSHARTIADALDALTEAEQDELGRLCKKLGLGMR